MGGRWEKKFCNLEARTFINKNIKRVELEGGNKVFNQEEIMNHVKLVYEQLYTNTDSEVLDIDLEDILGNTEVPKLDRLESEKLES